MLLMVRAVGENCRNADTALAPKTAQHTIPYRSVEENHNRSPSSMVSCELHTNLVCITQQRSDHTSTQEYLPKDRITAQASTSQRKKQALPREADRVKHRMEANLQKRTPERTHGPAIKLRYPREV